MIRMSVLYPSGEGSTFNHDYYRDTHIPLCVSSWATVKRTEVDKGINGPNVAAVHFFFDSMDDMQAAMGAAGTGAVMADVANYTNITPVMQISEVVS
jgi:uncharacterized protein (TIGR02118 family)